MLERPDEPGTPAMRVSDAERNQVVELLRRHTGAGYLTLDEFSDRVGQVFEARTRADLELVTMDLPAAPRAVPEVQRRKSRRWAVGVMSAAALKGRWRASGEVHALAIMGGVRVDLRQAEIDGDELTIYANSIMGGVDIIVPEGIAVDVSGVPLMGTFESRIKEVPRLPGQPLIRVRGMAFMGGVTVRTKQPRDQVASGAEKAQERALRQADHARRQAERHAQRALARGGRRESWREDVRSQAAPDGTVTIMFTDMENYTEMTLRLGDIEANRILSLHNDIVRRQIATHGGFEVKSQGDSLMVAFQGASQALRCAVAIQRAFDDYCRQHPDEPIRVHVGLHTGEVIKEVGDFIGRTVIVASRIADEAKGGEILVSNLVKGLSDGTGEFRFDEGREVTLKGLSEAQRVYSVAWHD